MAFAGQGLGCSRYEQEGEICCVMRMTSAVEIAAMTMRGYGATVAYLPAIGTPSHVRASHRCLAASACAKILETLTMRPTPART